MLTVDDILRRNLERCAEEIRQAIEASGQRASGRTQASIRVEVDERTGTVYGRQAFGTLEQGRRPGKTPRGFASVIRQWMQDKGISARPVPYVRQASERWQPKYTAEERGYLQMAGAIAHKIRTEGTKLYREGGREDVYTPAIEACISRIKAEMAGLYQEEVLDDLRTIKNA